MQSLSICFITPFYPLGEEACGGLGSYLRRTTRALSSMGHDVHVIVESIEENSREVQGVKIHSTIPVWEKTMRVDKIDRVVPRKLNNPYQNIKAAWAVWRRWKSLREEVTFDAVQIANPRAPGLFFGRENDVFTTTRLSNHARVWDESVGIHPTMGKRLEWFLDRRAIRSTKAVYGPCERVAQLVAKDYGLPEVQVIEPPFFLTEDSQASKKNTDQPYAVFFGGLTRMKGLHILAEALPNILKKCPDFHLKCFGLGKDELKGAPILGPLVRKHPNLADHISLASRLPPNQLLPIIAQARMIVLPSIIDNTPNTLLESMAMQRPVVGLKGSGFEQFIDGENGLLAEKQTPSELATAVIKVWKMTTGERKTMGEAAANRIRQLQPDLAIASLLEHFQRGKSLVAAA